MTAAGEGVLVVGYGNVLRADDGVGCVVAAALAGDPRLGAAQVRSAHQLTPELALDLSRASLVVFVDASADLAPGEIATSVVDEPAAAGPAWSHQLAPAGLVALARELWGTAAPVHVVRVGAASFDDGAALSPAVAAAVPRAADAVAAIVAEHGRA